MRSGDEYKDDGCGCTGRLKTWPPKHCMTVFDDWSQHTMPEIVVRYCMRHPTDTPGIPEEAFDRFVKRLEEITACNDDRRKISEQTKKACRDLTGTEKVCFLSGVAPFIRAMDIRGAINIDPYAMMKDEKFGDMAAEIFLWAVEWFNGNIVPACVFFGFLVDYVCRDEGCEPDEERVLQ